MISENKTIRKRFIISTIFVVIINGICLSLYFKIGISPYIERNNAIKNDIDNLITENISYDEFINKFNLYKEKYNFEYLIKDNNYKTVVKTNKNTSQLLYSNIITFDNTSYLLEIYINREMTIGDAVTGFMLFQFCVVFVISIIFTFFVNKNILTPIDKIINDIKKYKLGHLPKKIKVKGQIDLIQNEFVDLVELLEEEKKEQNRIIASISHDIKTPLTSIIGYSNLINEEDLTKEQIIKYNEKINLKSKNIKEILNCFDDYLINSTNQSIKFKKILIHDLVKQINDDYLLELEFKNITLIINCNCYDLYINIDISKIKRAIANIIQNSIRYIKEDGKIVIDINYNKENFVFEISDNGKGVDKKIIKKIFDPLYTTDNSRKISGLGLSICKEFITLHNGTISAYNNDMGGLTIKFTIPNNI